MARQTKIVNMSIPVKLYRAVEDLAKKRDTTRSDILRESLEQYVVSEQNWQEIYRAGEESAKKLGIKNEGDIERLVEEYRHERKS
jgi:predicted transcriptional regulator